MDEGESTEEKETPSTPQTQSAPQASLETKQSKQKSWRDTKKAYSQPALNGSPGFSIHEEEGDVIFSPVRRLEFSSGNDETKQSDLASIDSNFLLTQDLSSSLENFGNFDNLLGETTSQSDLDKENLKPNQNDISALVISNVQCTDNISVLPSKKTVTDTLHDRQALPVQGIDSLDKEAFSLLLQVPNQDDQPLLQNRNTPADSVNNLPDQDKQLQLDEKDQQAYPLKHESNVPALATQEHRYPADGRNKQTVKTIVTNSSQSVQSPFLPTYPTNLRPGLSYPPLVRSVPYGAEMEEKNRTKPQVIMSPVSNSSSRPKCLSNVPDSVNLPEPKEPSNDDRLQFSPKTLLTVVPDRTKFMQGGSKGDIEACPRPEDMPGGAMHEIQLLRSQLQSAIQVPLKCQIDTDLFDYSQNGVGPDCQSDQLMSTVSDIPSISTVDAKDNVSWLMDYANNGLVADESNQQLLEPTSSSSSTTTTAMLTVPVSHSLQAGHYRQLPLTNHTQYAAYLDNIKLKEELEKERFRRRHCEKYIEQLNAKMLDVQEQLAIAVSANRKKEILVEHLDKQLGKIMSTWKTKDAEKMQLINELQKEKSFQEQIIDDQRKLTSKMRDDFSDVMEELNKEKEKTSRVIHKLEEMEATEKSLEKQLLNEKEQNHGMVEEWEYQSERLRTSEKLLNELNHQLEQEQTKSIEREQELLKKIEEITESHRNLQEKEKEQAEELLNKVSESETKIHSLEKELSELKLKLENVSRENESLKLEIGIIEAKHENNQKQLETRLESQMEKEITAIIEDVHKKRESFENRLQEEHKQQIISLNEHHSVELNVLLQKYQGDLKHKDQKFFAHLQNLEQTIKSLRDENTSLKILNQRLESQRTEALNKFQNIMQLHWNEAISILGGSANVDSQAFSEVMEHSPESVTSEEAPIPPPSFPGKEPVRCMSSDPNQVHPHPQTSSPKKDALNISSFTVSSEQISTLANGHRRPKPPSEANGTDVVPNYLKIVREENLKRNHALQNSERVHRIKDVRESSKSQSLEKQDLTLLEPDANILWYEKDSLQPSFIQTGPYMTAVPIQPPIQQNLQNHMLTTAHRPVNNKTSDHDTRLTSADQQIQNVEYCPDTSQTPPIKQSSQPKDGDQSGVFVEASKLKDDYQILSERLMQQNSRQEELQHFIQMLLNRMPTSKMLPSMNTDSTNQECEEKRSEFLPVEVANESMSRMSESINMPQSQEKPERLVQTQHFPLEISQPQQSPTASFSYHPGTSVNSFPSGLTASSLQDIQNLLDIYKAQENGEIPQPNLMPKNEEEKSISHKKQDIPARTVQRSTGFVKQSVRPNKGYEMKLREKADGRRSRDSKPHERKKMLKTSGSGSNSSNTSSGNPVWK